MFYYSSMKMDVDTAFSPSFSPTLSLRPRPWPATIYGDGGQCIYISSFQHLSAAFHFITFPDLLLRERREVEH